MRRKNEKLSNRQKSCILINLSVKTFFLLICMAGQFIINAQPSGGPYGPVRKTYEIPKTIGSVYYIAPFGDAQAKGETLNNPTTLEAAIERVETGDVIIMRGGTYRTGNITLNQGVTIQPHEDEQPVLKGTFVADKWKPTRGGLWKTRWEHFFPMEPANWWMRERNPDIPLHRFNNDMVFINGKFLQSAGWLGEVDENSYFIDYKNKTVYIGTDPTNKEVEITAFNVAIHRITEKCHGKKSDNKGYTFKGLTFTQYAYRALEIDGKNPEGVSAEANHGKDVIGTTIEDCTISYCSRVAAYLRGDHLTLRNCLISNTVTEGIYVLSSSDVLLEKNIFTKNNIENIKGYFPAAVKIFNQCYRVTCRDNLVIDHPNSNGIWYDVGNIDGVFVNNRLENIGTNKEVFNKNSPWPARNAFFFEISKGAVCAGNVFVNCDHGIMVLNSSDVKIYQNTLVNSMLCIDRTERSAAGDHFGWHPATGPDIDERTGHIVVNNLITASKEYDRPLVFLWQKDSLCGWIKDSQVKEFDYNVYLTGYDVKTNPLILWSPYKDEQCQKIFGTPAELHKSYNEFASNSNYYENYFYSLYKCPILKDFNIINNFPKKQKGAQLPAEVKEALNLPRKTEPYIGAYPRKK